jgi:predicted outer membrane repeat protein
MITNNEAAFEGGGLWNQSGTTMNVVSCILENNEAFGFTANVGGGAIFNNGGTLNIDSSQIMDNVASGDMGSGGGLFSTKGNVTISNTAFRGNIANRAGGGIEIIDGDLDITNSVLTENEVLGTPNISSPGNGGAMHVSGMNSTINISGSIINMNEARRQGGGLWNQRGSTMNISDCTIDGNLTDGPLVTQGGGGIYNRGGVLNIETSTISNNVTSGTSAAGGGVHNDSLGVTNIMRSTISGNSAQGVGGGIYCKGDSMIINAVTLPTTTPPVLVAVSLVCMVLGLPIP